MDEDSILQVRMFGNFSIRKGEQEINDNDNRSKKVWLLLAYMIYCRNRSVTQEELVSLLWSDDESSSNPLNHVSPGPRLFESAGRCRGTYAHHPQRGQLRLEHGNSVFL